MDEYDEANTACSSDDSKADKCSPDKLISDKENLAGEEDRRRDNTCEVFGDDEDGGVQLGQERRMFRPTWNTGAGG